MTTHAEMIEDTHGNLVDVWYYCSALCYRDDTGKSAHGHAYPAPDWGDSDTYCHHCGQFLHAGTDIEPLYQRSDWADLDPDR